MPSDGRVDAVNTHHYLLVGRSGGDQVLTTEHAPNTGPESTNSPPGWRREGTPAARGRRRCLCGWRDGAAAGRLRHRHHNRLIDGRLPRPECPKRDDSPGHGSRSPREPCTAAKEDAGDPGSPPCANLAVRSHATGLEVVMGAPGPLARSRCPVARCDPDGGAPGTTPRRFVVAVGGPATLGVSKVIPGDRPAASIADLQQARGGRPRDRERRSATELET